MNEWECGDTENKESNAWYHHHLVALKQTLFSGFIQFGAGLSVGLSCLAAGIAIGITGDAGVRATAQQPRMFVGMVRVIFVPIHAIS